MDRRELVERVKQFAHRCVKLALALPDASLGRHICGQLIRCSTGAQPKVATPRGGAPRACLHARQSDRAQ